MNTHTVKAGDIQQRWHLVDADNKPLGRLAVEVAKVLRGKHRPEYSPHLDLGDHVVVVNADKIHLSGKKRQQKVYYSYSGYTGGLKVRRVQDLLERDPARVVKHAVKGMLPSNRLGRRLLKKLKVYAGAQHPHEAQKPQSLPLS
ncbi:MAG: 50S ribosomal protein L13 [Candidatus Krumholzibacteriia bacterium]